MEVREGAATPGPRGKRRPVKMLVMGRTTRTPARLRPAMRRKRARTPARSAPMPHDRLMPSHSWTRLDKTREDPGMPRWRLERRRSLQARTRKNHRASDYLRSLIGKPAECERSWGRSGASRRGWPRRGRCSSRGKPRRDPRVAHRVTRALRRAPDGAGEELKSNAFEHGQATVTLDARPSCTEQRSRSRGPWRLLLDPTRGRARASSQWGSGRRRAL